MKMTTVHRTQIVGKCPRGHVDVYDAEFTVIGYGAISRVLWVEEIQKQIEILTADKTTQEQLTYNLAVNLDCHVRTVGTHSRFKTACAADPTQNNGA